MRRICVLAATLLVSVMGGMVSAEEIPIPGTRGAVPISFSMPYDGKASIGLYTKDDQLVRIIGQGMELPKGDYRIDWDGMDMWGRSVSADIELQARIIHHQGVKAFYEMSVGTGTWPKDAWTWPARPVEQPDGSRIAGGWLGDHSPPSDVVAIEDQVFVSSTLSEFGHNILAADLNGRKKWGTQLAGWTGPRMLFNDRNKQVVAALGKGSINLMAVDVETYKKSRLWGYPRLDVEALAMHDGQVHALVNNLAYFDSPLQATFRSIDFPQTQPQILSGKSFEFQLSPKGRFNTVFTKGGHFQTGLRPMKSGRFCHVLVPFTADTEVGTFLLGKLDDIERVEFYVLDQGLEYDGKKHSPIDGNTKGGEAKLEVEDDAFSLGEADLELDEGFSRMEHGSWTFVAESKADKLINIVPLNRKDISTRALYIRIVPQEKDRDNKKWRVKEFKMCRGFSKRFDALDTMPKVTVIGELEKAWKPKKAFGWKLRTGAPLSINNELKVVLDYGKPQKMDAIATLNHLVTRYEVDIFRGKGDPATAPDSDWEPAATFKGRRIRKTGWTTSSWYHNDQYAYFYETQTTSAIRLRYRNGFGRAKIHLGWHDSDPRRVDCSYFTPIRMVDQRVVPPKAYYLVHDIDSKKEITRQPLDGIDVERMAIGNDGTFYTVVNSQLHISTPAPKKWQHKPFGDTKYAALRAMRIQGNQLMVAERGGDLASSMHVEKAGVSTLEEEEIFEENDRRNPAIYLVDLKSGKTNKAVGGKAAYEAGPWDSSIIGKVSGAALDKNGKIWVAEGSFVPKRVSRFNAKGECEFEVFGPPEYGGGGFLDPGADAFYYRGLEFDVSFSERTSLPRAFNRRYRDSKDIGAEGNSFGWTHMGRIIEHQGHRYAIGTRGGMSIALKESLTWEPVFFIGPATGPIIKAGDQAWTDHWLAQDRVGRVLMWRDANGDRNLQVEEAQLLQPEELLAMGFYSVNDDGEKIPKDRIFGGGSFGWNLDIYSGGYRIPLAGIDANAVPQYDLTHNYRVGYKWPIISQTVAHGSRAKPNVGGSWYVGTDGSISREGQPFVIQPDGSVLGGDPSVPSEEERKNLFQPPLLGTREQYTLRYAGGAMTKSDIGEVVVSVGDNGKWSIMSHKYRLLVDIVFDGQQGGWGSDIPPQGDGTFEVTHRKFPGETFFGHFVKAHNDNYYTVVGKGWHSLNRIEGLDSIEMTTIPVQNTPERYAKNAKLRELIIEDWKAFLRAQKMALTHRIHGSYKIANRFKGTSIDVDGILDEWGGRSKLRPIDEKIFFGGKPEDLFYDIAWDERGIYIAYLGRSYIGSSHDDISYLFKRGFAFDFRWRTKDSRASAAQAGDKRLVFGKLNGQYTAALYDYVDPNLPQGQYQQFVSPVLTTAIAHVRQPKGVKVAVQEIAIDDSDHDSSVVEAEWLNNVSGGVHENNIVVGRTRVEDGKQRWSAEVFVPWSVIGAKPGEKGGLKVRADVGILGANREGTQVGERRYWSNPIADRPVDDVAFEALIQPNRWGWMLFEEEPMSKDELFRKALGEVRKKK